MADYGTTINIRRPEETTADKLLNSLPQFLNSAAAIQQNKQMMNLKERESNVRMAQMNAQEIRAQAEHEYIQEVRRREQASENALREATGQYNWESLSSPETWDDAFSGGVGNSVAEGLSLYRQYMRDNGQIPDDNAYLAGKKQQDMHYMNEVVNAFNAQKKAVQAQHPTWSSGEVDAYMQHVHSADNVLRNAEIVFGQSGVGPQLKYLPPVEQEGWIDTIKGMSPWAEDKDPLIGPDGEPIPYSSADGFGLDDAFYGAGSAALAYYTGKLGLKGLKGGVNLVKNTPGAIADLARRLTTKGPNVMPMHMGSQKAPVVYGAPGTKAGVIEKAKNLFSGGKNSKMINFFKNLATNSKLQNVIKKKMGSKFLFSLMATGTGIMAPEAISTGLGLVSGGLMMKDIQKLLADEDIQRAMQ
tara:strand:+ start:4206 stop:5450 length:1245 start_codon:yes stop_codon:yes gene_type:complete